MIQHILLFRFNEGTSKADISRIMEKFDECKEKLPGLKSIQHGENLSSKKHLAQGFTYGVIMGFESEEDIAAYNGTDEHREAQELQKSAVKEILVFDIAAGNLSPFEE